MRSRGFRTRSVRSWCRWPIRFACSLGFVAALLASSLDAQEGALVEAMADVLALEDARRYDATIIEAAAGHGDPLVRRRAALAMGRTGDPAATPLLLELLLDSDTVVQRDAAFALGLLGDRTVLRIFRDRLLGRRPGDHTETDAEVAEAVTRIGGPAAVELIRSLLDRAAGALEEGRPAPAALRALGEVWRFGADAPIDALLPFAGSTVLAVRERAVYSLMRLRPPRAAGAFLAATRDRDPRIRSFAARGLTRELVDSAGLDPDRAATRLVELTSAEDVRVRINALRALATYHMPRHAAAVRELLSDPIGNVRVQAAATLAALGGPVATEALRERVQEGRFAVRREALLGLVRLDRLRALKTAAAWIIDDDWYLRLNGADVLGELGGDTAVAWLERLVEDENGRVAGRAYGALIRTAPERADRLARDLLTHPDAVARAQAAERVAQAPQRSDIDRLVRAYGLAETDSISTARIAVLSALAAVADLGFSERVAVEDALFDAFPSSDDERVRRAAQQRFPAAAQRWGPPRPVETGRTPAEYRAIVRELVLPAERQDSTPGLTIETERGTIEVKLFAAEAPMTVAALLRLAADGFYDDGFWHRVVPNFVVQDGDPRGDGQGGPGFRLRDENSRRRYARGTMGMALAGPDTGGSQFFITLSTQPHLEGTYPVVGRVEAGMEVVDQLTQGDRIRRIRRR